jgi:TonB family protein
MSYRSLLFCPDEKTARVVTQVLTEVDFRVEPCHEPFAAVKKLMAEHFDAIVVDCDNEQNAALLFKSAHNSGANQASLAVAVVEGQSGVAKAFRIGANLVLTKPINVEQSKGTLRVARGLLRKTDTARPTTTQPQFPTPSFQDVRQSSVPMSPVKPASAPVQQSPSLPVAPAGSMSSFELEDEVGPAPDPTEAALLESMPDPSSSMNREGATGPGRVSKQYPWQPIAKPMAEPMASALRQAAEAAGNPEFGTSETSKSRGSAEILNLRLGTSSVGSVGQGAAVAPARDRPIAKAEPASAATEVEPPIFSSLGEKTQGEDQEAGGSRKLLIAALILAAVAVAGYVAWPKISSGIHPAGAEKPTAPSQAQSAELAVPTAPEEQPAGPSAPIANTHTSQATAVQVPDITLSTAGAKPSAETKSARSAKAATIAPDKVESTLSQPEPLLVKNDNPKGPQPPSPAAESEEPPPAPFHGVSNQDDRAISGIVTAPAANMPLAPQTLKVSQGVAQGLLMKRVQPVYPLRAQQARIQGAVELSATIGKDGSISNLKVMSGDPILTQAAVEAVKQWKYRPYLLDGQPVEIQTQITVNFRLP